MFNVGGDAGKAYRGDEGKGFASILSLPKADNIAVWKFENDEKKNNATALKQQQENQKAMGLLDNIKPAGFYNHLSKIQDMYGSHIDSVSRVAEGNPYDARTPNGASRLKDFDAVQLAINTSKAFDAQFKQYSAMDKKGFSPESVAAADSFFEKAGNDLEGLMQGKYKMSVLKPKNPIASETIALTPLTKADEEYKKRGEDLIDNPDAVYSLLKDTMEQPETKAFYQNKFDGLSDKEQTNLQDEAIKQTAAQRRTITPQMLLAQQFLPSVIGRTPYDELKTIKELAASVGDDETLIENGDVTTKQVNKSQKFKTDVYLTAQRFLSSESPDAKRAQRKYGIAASDVAARTPQAIAAITDMSNQIETNKKQSYERREDELKKWQTDALKSDKASNNSGGEFIRQLSTAALTNNPNALSLGIAANVINMGANTRVNKVQPTGDGKTISVDYTTFEKEDGGNIKQVPQSIKFDMDNDAVRAALQMRYASKVKEDKTDINAIQSALGKGKFDNTAQKEQSKKQQPKEKGKYDNFK